MTELRLTVEDFNEIIECGRKAVGSQNAKKFNWELYEGNGIWILTDESSYAVDERDGPEAIITIDENEPDDPNEIQYDLNDDYEFLRPLFNKLVAKAMGWK